MSHRTIDFEKGEGLVPAIVQDADTGRVLMMGYMNQEALSHTQRTGKVTFFSRSRHRLWTKGETSGNYLELVELAIDCDGDTLLIKARPHGPTCHTGNESCFDLEPDRGWLSLPEAMGGLEREIRKQKRALPECSDTPTILNGNVKDIAFEIENEAIEVALAAKRGDRQALVRKTADLFHHTLKLLIGLGIPSEQVARELWRRK
jgi:phosphoribosyl-ATP pyrophosphohydrolase/phosphoribosyl-AMP cyclohydrolase